VKHFDFADIEQVNRIELKPGEIVLFRTEYPLTEAEAHGLKEHFVGTPLEDRAFFLSGDWKVATVTAEEVPPDPRWGES
jgi:hypothetical protein